MEVLIKKCAYFYLKLANYLKSTRIHKINLNYLNRRLYGSIDKKMCRLLLKACMFKHSTGLTEVYYVKVSI